MRARTARTSASSVGDPADTPAFNRSTASDAWPSFPCGMTRADAAMLRLVLNHEYIFWEYSVLTILIRGRGLSKITLGTFQRKSSMARALS